MCVCVCVCVCVMFLQAAVQNYTIPRCEWIVEESSISLTFGPGCLSYSSVYAET